MPKKLTPRGEAAPPPAPNVASAALKKEKPKRSTSSTSRVQSGTKFIRNIRAIPVRVRLDSGRLIELGPRGSVEDLAPVNKDEQNDAKFLGNIGLLYQVISPAEAKDIIAKQVTNAQTARSNHLVELLRNEKGEAYDQSDVHLSPAPGSNDIIAATIEDDINTRHTEQNKAIVRTRPTTAPEQAAVPGSIQNPLPEIPSDISAEDIREFIAWRDAQRAREALSVQVEPVERVDE